MVSHESAKSFPPGVLTWEQGLNRVCLGATGCPYVGWEEVGYPPGTRTKHSKIKQPENTGSFCRWGRPLCASGFAGCEFRGPFPHLAWPWVPCWEG